MLRIAVIVCFSVISMVLVACFATARKTEVQQVVELYREDISLLKADVENFVKLIENKADKQLLQAQFKKARKSYKQTEWLAEYYNSYTAKSINGPAIEEVEPDEKSKVIAPEGFQVIEELLFPTYDTATHTELLQEAKILQSNIGRLAYMASVLETTDAHVFDALRLQVFRVISLGISGFDSPIANYSIEETISSIQAIEKYYLLYSNRLYESNKKKVVELQKLFVNAEEYLVANKDFNSFNRLEFITAFLNPLSENLLAVQMALNIPVFKEPRFLNANARNLFAENIFNADFYAPGRESYSTADKVLLGKKLFYDGILSADGKRSCGSCHDPSKAFTDGLKASLSISGKNIRRNSPTLINAGLQSALFYDMRVNYLEDQAKDVITNKDEMHGDLSKAILKVKSNESYQSLFTRAYGTPDVTEDHIKNSIASYIRSLTGLQSRFDEYMRGDKAALNPEEMQGFNLFMGKAKCATCHFVPLFNGNNPPSFIKTDAEVIGVPATRDTNHAVIDSDEGKFSLYKVAIHKHAFKTPTLRNIELTAPYMHNGVFNTLEEVVDFYDRGGGAGLGLQLENQTLPADRLNLNEKEKKALVAFMKALTDEPPSK